MYKLGKDMDIFGGLLDSEASDQALEEVTTDIPEDLGVVDQATDTTGDDTNNEEGENSTEDTVTDTGDVEGETTEEDFEKDSNTEKTGEEVTEEAGSILEDLLKDVEDKIENTDDSEQLKLLEDLQKNIQEGQIRIRELEEENKMFQDKYFEKFSETSEYNLMKPYIDIVQNDPELFLLVKSIKSDNSEDKLNNLVAMLEKESGVNVSSYLTDNGKSAISGVTSSKSGGDMSMGDMETQFEDIKPFKEDFY